LLVDRSDLLVSVIDTEGEEHVTFGASCSRGRSERVVTARTVSRFARSFRE
jgi:hypothetical protein